MELLIPLTTLIYILSAGGYLCYLFFQKNPLFQIGYGLILCGFLLHTAALGIAVLQTDRLPVHNLQETLRVAAWAVAGVFWFFQHRFNLKILGAYAAPLAALIMTAAFLLPSGPLPVNSAFNGLWFAIHIISVFAGEAALALACGSGILYLLQERAIKRKRPGFFYKRLPSLELLDSTGYGAIVVGFTLLTIGLATGFIYAKSVWGRFWSWDPKEVWSGITWLLYAALLHERLTVGWRGRRAAILAIVGFAVMLFTFLGVNFLLKGHHGPFTRW